MNRKCFFVCLLPRRRDSSRPRRAKTMAASCRGGMVDKRIILTLLLPTYAAAITQPTYLARDFETKNIAIGVSRNEICVVLGLAVAKKKRGSREKGEANTATWRQRG